jgi:hypothetical protein
METQYETEQLTGGQPDHRITVDDPDGDVKTIVLDLRRALKQDPQRVTTSPVYMRSALDPETEQRVVEIEAHAESSLEWLASWLEGTAHHYRTEYVDASYEHRAAEGLRRPVSEYLAEPVTEA